MKKLYVKNDDGTFEEISALLTGPHLKPIKKTTIQDAFSKYIKNCTANKCVKNQSNEKLYFQIFQKFLMEKGVDYIDEVTRENIDQFESLLLKSMKASSVNRRFCAIRNFFNKCVDWNMLVESPCSGYRKRKIEQNPFKPWPPELFEKFLLLCNGVWAKIFEFLWLTGCRPMELKNLRWTDIDYQNQTIRFRCGKNAQVSRLFPITKQVDKFLHGLKFDGPFVFSINKRQLNNDNLYHYCKKRMVRLGLKGFTVYGIRHGFGTKLARQGVSAFYIAELMGHSDLKTTRGYVHSDKNLLIQILNKAK